jgi:3-oxoacyl-[acyl-carrier protein] reductase
MRLKNKVAIITGGGSGIGKESSIMFAKEGASVVVADIDEKGGKETVEEIHALGLEAFYVKLNVSNREESRQMVLDTIDKYGRIDVLVNNAGITQDALVAKMTEEQWDRVIDVNLKGVFNCTQAIVDVMIEQGSGSIINTSSIVGLFGNIGQTNYAVTKSGVIGMTKSLGKELGKKGIRVNAVAPGFVATPMTEKVPDKILELMKGKTPLGRLGMPKDIANAYTFLASDESSFINGTVLSVDGGLVL